MAGGVEGGGGGGHGAGFSGFSGVGEAELHNRFLDHGSRPTRPDLRLFQNGAIYSGGLHREQTGCDWSEWDEH